MVWLKNNTDSDIIFFEPTLRYVLQIKSRGILFLEIKEQDIGQYTELGTAIANGLIRIVRDPIHDDSETLVLWEIEA